MQITAELQTDVGRERKGNEDFGLVDEELGLCVVCDGMGGHSAGEVASKMTAETVQRIVRESASELTAFDARERDTDALAALLRRGVEQASAEVYSKAMSDSDKRGMGTTCTALLTRGGKGVLAQVGDSRLYLVRGGQAYQLSDDHSFVGEAVRRGMMTPEQAQKSEHSNMLTRAVGAQAGVQVDTLVFDILPGDALVLCTDGLHQYLAGPQELAELVSKEPAANKAADLIELANERGGSDNITVALVRAPDGDVPEALSRRAEQAQANLAALRRIDLFHELNLAGLARVAAGFKLRSYGPREEIIREGDTSEALFVMVKGSAEVLRGDDRIAILGSGSHFGEMALLSSRPRSATVRTLEPVELLVLERSDFYEVMRQDAVLAATILWRLAQTLSLRLDDVYHHTMAENDDTPPSGMRATVPFGLFPSPFDRRHG